jgi:hypothetical protein
VQALSLVTAAINSVKGSVGIKVGAASATAADKQVHVQAVQAGGAADRSGAVHAGDTILKV